MIVIDTIGLARRQIEIDRERTARFPHLFAHKAERMLVSPLALLRGSAPLFYELLEHHPELAKGPAGEGWLTGDAHIENFGAYRAGRLRVTETRGAQTKEAIVFDVNDFDEAVVGRWHWDVLRLTTSLLLASREAGANGRSALAHCDALLHAYVQSAFHSKKAPAPPNTVVALIDKVSKRTRKELLDARTEVVHGKRQFVLGPRYEPLSTKVRVKADRALQKYAKNLALAERVPADALEVLDAAFRVAGTGSLGSLRVAVLVRGKGGVDGGWIFDMKAEGAPSAARLARRSKLDPAQRVCAAVRSCLARPPRQIGTTRLRGQSMFVRRLAPQEDKIDFRQVPSTEMLPFATHLGALLGSAHRHGAKRRPAAPWNDKDLARLVRQATALAGIHEGVYLAYCDLMRR